ncbi:hypothetical protein [Geoalkalibacter sp.]|uniref:hypothetical protein n=1 Tax=Geoalkalibacter sp. TaxID=3041440 RepID=UPI00272E50C3|nr:hypothetical protein [Geoalkalibacter sp.]
MQKVLSRGYQALLTAVATLTFAIGAQGAVPAPPVNQFIGIPDTVFGQMHENDCRACHGPNPPQGVPVDLTLLKERHHNLAGLDPITQLAEIIPQGTVAPYGIAGEHYGCLSCHSVEPADGNYAVSVIRDCTVCHDTASPHHLSPQAQAGNCQACHGSLVDNGLLPENREVRNGVSVPKWLPTYSPSLITPWPSKKSNAGANGEGSCFYCHGVVPTDPNNPETYFIVDPVSLVKVYSPADTHHLPGFFNPQNCAWCHPNGGTTATTPDSSSIRTCQNCHGIPSLHNIQYDIGNPEDPQIVPGRMTPGYGHIGADSDCLGCHGFSIQQQSAAPASGPIIPQLTGLSRNVVAAGRGERLELQGFNLTNRFAPLPGFSPLEYDAVVVLTNAAGERLELHPSALNPTRIEVDLPADLAPGNYRIAARKLDKISNPEILVIKRDTWVDSADLQADGTVLITGRGFGMEPPRARGMGVEIEGISATVLHWQDDLILVAAQKAQPGHRIDVLSNYWVSSSLKRAAGIADEDGRGSKHAVPKGAKNDPKKAQTKKGR